MIDDVAWDGVSVELPPARVWFPISWLTTGTFWTPDDDEINTTEDTAGEVRKSWLELTVQGCRRGWDHVAGADNSWAGNSHHFRQK